MFTEELLQRRQHKFEKFSKLTYLDVNDLSLLQTSHSNPRMS